MCFDRASSISGWDLDDAIRGGFGVASLPPDGETEKGNGALEADVPQHAGEKFEHENGAFDQQDEERVWSA